MKIKDNVVKGLKERLYKDEEYIHDIKGQLSRNIQKSNDYCLKFEKDAKVVENVKKIQFSIGDALVRPFLEVLKNQAQASKR